MYATRGMQTSRFIKLILAQRVAAAAADRDVNRRHCARKNRSFVFFAAGVVMRSFDGGKLRGYHDDLHFSADFMRNFAQSCNDG